MSSISYLSANFFSMAYYTDIAREDRLASYDFIEKFIEENVADWSKWNIDIQTDDIEALFSEKIGEMENTEFEFLLLHSGYIPDYYGKDSSQETLYSKLVEALVCEWAKRIGFTESHLQKQKSNKEDITIMVDNKVIVCDAKSFRLGRSQATPNVKDVIKKEAYTTWLSAYDEEARVGGLTTFPSMHDWKKGGAAYHYYTEGNPSIMMLYYEQMAYMLHHHIEASQVIDFLNSYEETYPEPSEDKSYYWKGIRDFLFNNDSYEAYMDEATKYAKEKVVHTIMSLAKRVESIEQDVDKQLDEMDIDEFKALARDSLIQIRTKELSTLKERVAGFRLSLFPKEEGLFKKKEED